MQSAATLGVPRPASCDFRVAATVPREGYEELGVLEMTRGTSEISKFKLAVAPQVCQAGGDLVTTDVNGYGFIVRGVVFARHEE